MGAETNEAVPSMFNTLNSQRAERNPDFTDPERQLLGDVLDLIDEQSLGNFGQIRHSEIPGVAIPYSYVDVSKLSGDIMQRQRELGIEVSLDDVEPRPESVIPDDESDADREQRENLDRLRDQKTTYVVIPGYAPPPENNFGVGNENFQDRVMRTLPQSIRHQDVRVYVVGYPFGLGGEVSEDWIRRTERDGYEAYGEVLTPFFKELAQGTDRIVINGHSMGATVAKAVSAMVDDETRSKVKLLIDAPADTHTLAEGLRMLTGFIHSGVMGPMTWAETIKGIGRGNRFRKYFEQVLREKGIQVPDAGPEREAYFKLHKRAADSELRRVIFGKTKGPVSDEVRTFERSNIYGSLFKDVSRLKRLINYRRNSRTGILAFAGKDVDGNANRTLHVPTHYAHFIDRMNRRTHRRWMNKMLRLPRYARRFELEEARKTATTAADATASPEKTEPVEGAA